jgi:chaperone modulatory protein CbpM
MDTAGRERPARRDAFDVIPLEAVATRFPEIAPDELALWIERRWVRAERAPDGAWRLTEMDVARIRLLMELRVTLEVTDDLIPMVLSLIDQLYDARRTIRALLVALDEQPAEVRSAILEAARGDQPSSPLDLPSNSSVRP